MPGDSARPRAPKDPADVSAETRAETGEELEARLLEGLKRGEAKPLGEEDWERLRRRALASAELRKLG